MPDQKEAYFLKGSRLLFSLYACPPKAELHAVGGRSALCSGVRLLVKGNGLFCFRLLTTCALHLTIQDALCLPAGRQALCSMQIFTQGRGFIKKRGFTKGHTLNKV